MKTALLVMGIILLLSTGMALAHGHDFAETKQLIDSGISCDELTDEQLEAIGEYYMEQMHPGEAHEMMDKMMGGEGSEELKQMHIQMAKGIYCNEDVGGMMDMMMGGNMMQGMMDSNMMQGMMSGQPSQTGMMSGTTGYVYWGAVNLLYAALLVGLVVLVYLWVAKTWKGMKGAASKIRQ